MFIPKLINIISPAAPVSSHKKSNCFQSVIRLESSLDAEIETAKGVKNEFQNNERIDLNQICFVMELMDEDLN